MSTTGIQSNKQSILNRIRRNHGLEHATLHVLAERLSRRSMAGYSDWRGFWILGELSLEDVAEAVQQAQARLLKGEHELAVHPNCGTNFVVSGSMAGLGAVLALFGVGRRRRDWLERLPLAATLATMALILAQPLGFLIQERFTTSPDLGSLQVLEITATRRGPMPAYRILTRG
jgi:hypothetical protein